MFSFASVKVVNCNQIKFQRDPDNSTQLLQFYLCELRQSKLLGFKMGEKVFICDKSSTYEGALVSGLPYRGKFPIKD